jgi:Ca2+-binding EF-hand superfamily protein
MSTISGVNSSSSTSDPWAALKAQRSQMQAKMFAKVDTDSSGSVDKAELKTMLSEVSQKTGTSIGSDTEATFTKMDSNADGNLSSDELGKGMQSLMPPPSTMDFAQSRSADGASGSAGSQDDLFAKIDTNGDGSVDKAELQTLTDKVKSDTGNDTTDMFAKLDKDSDGKLTQAEFGAGKPQGTDSAKGPGGAGGPPPAGGPGGPGGAGKSESTSDTSYDTLDTNQDGTVSELERLVGAIKDAAKASKGDSTDSAKTSGSDSKETSASFVEVAKLAKQLYSQIAASLSGQSNSTLSATA